MARMLMALRCAVQGLVFLLAVKGCSLGLVVGLAHSPLLGLAAGALLILHVQ